MRTYFLTIQIHIRFPIRRPNHHKRTLAIPIRWDLDFFAIPSDIRLIFDPRQNRPPWKWHMDGLIEFLIRFKPRFFFPLVFCIKSKFPIAIQILPLCPFKIRTRMFGKYGNCLTKKDRSTNKQNA